MDSSQPPEERINRKHRSISISNAILEHSRQSGKRVSFNKGGDIIVGSPSNSPRSPASPCSITDSDDDGSNGLASPASGESPGFLRKPSASASTVPTSEITAKLSALKRFRSQPHANHFIAHSLPHEPHFMSLHNSNTNLPEFNKRPLTDTPIVSTVASPETKYNSSDDEDQLFSYFKTEDDSMPQRRKSSKAPPERPTALQKTKNISHLNLSDLNLSLPEVDPLRSDSISPTNTSEQPMLSLDSAAPISEKETPSPRTSEPKPEEPKTGAAEPAPRRPSIAKAKTSTTAVENEKDIRKKSSKIDPKILNQITEDILKEIPEDLQSQFKKTPSFDKLKNLLLSKQIPKQKKAYTLNIPGQTSSKISPDGKIASADVGSKLAIIMVGLPARGKSYITNKLTRYLNWIQHDCRVFNVGNTRRMDKNNNLGPASRPLPDTNTPSPFNGRSPENTSLSPTSHTADFFNPENEASTELREKWAMDTLDNLLDWVLNGSGSVGILDATNSTKKRRRKVLKRIQERTNGELKVLFLESICSDPALLDKNIRLKLSGPDYRDMDPEKALKDFLGRLRNYEKGYETIDEEEEQVPGFQYVKMINVGKKVVSYNAQGFLASQAIYFLLNFNLCERQIWLTRHGESVDNLSGRIGGDSGLTKRGKQFSKTLSRFLSYQRSEFRKKQLENFSSRLELRYNELTGKPGGNGGFSENERVEIPTEPSFCVWTSMLLRAIETGQAFNDQEYNVKAMRMLNELGGGKFDGMTYDEIRRQHPKEYEARLKNKLSYRYPGVGGESYLDVLVRLRPLINELERTTDHLLILSHRVVLRVLLAYFLNLDKSSIIELDVPLHTLYCLESNPYGTDYTMYEYDEVSDWFKKIEPEHQKNVKEVGVNFRERKYSVIPTAPPSKAKSSRDSSQRTQGSLSNFSLRKSLGQGMSEVNDRKSQLGFNSASSKKLADLIKMRKP